MEIGDTIVATGGLLRAPLGRNLRSIVQDKDHAFVVLVPGGSVNGRQALLANATTKYDPVETLTISDRSPIVILIADE
jgi:hypothetical protein